MASVDSIVWRRLDLPGRDACRLCPQDGGWKLEGVAVFLHDGHAAQLAYRVLCGPDWSTARGQVEGWVGATAVKLDIVRDRAGAWRLNGEEVAAVAGLTDLDLGFTPATNLIPIRRLELGIGESAAAPAVWLDSSDWMLKALPQSYRRDAHDTYWYAAPSFGYAASLEVAPSGFVRRYPDLWEVDLPAGA